MAKRSFDTVRIRLSQNLRSGSLLPVKVLCVRRDNSRGTKVLSVYRIVYTALSLPPPPPTINFILIVPMQLWVILIGIVRRFVPFPLGIWGRMWSLILYRFLSIAFSSTFKIN